MKMISLDKCLILKDKDKLIQQTKIRYKLIQSMVGTVCPEMLLCEIMKINGRISDIRENRI
jgi:hypothetical protein